jgi:hypothetical protein
MTEICGLATWLASGVAAIATTTFDFGGQGGRNLNDSLRSPVVRIHQTLRVTPAMAAGVSDRLWEMGAHAFHAGRAGPGRSHHRVAGRGVRPRHANEAVKEDLNNLPYLDKLLAMAERETRAATACARALRLTPQSIMHPRTAGRPSHEFTGRYVGQDEDEARCALNDHKPPWD